MKKQILVIILLAILVVCCLALTACGVGNASKGLENKLDTVSKEINQSLKNQDTVLSSIKTITENTKVQIGSIVSMLESNFASLNSDAKSIIDNTNTIISKQAELKATCSKIESELDLTKKSTEAIFMNRLFIIIGIIILAALQFIF